MKPILLYPRTENHTLFTDASNYAYSGVLTQAVDGPDDSSPIAYTSGSFSDMHQKWSATEKETFAIHHYVLKFDLHLRGVECILHCDHKPLEPFLSKGMNMPKLDRLVVELADYYITFIHIKGSNILADAVSRLKMLDIYKDPVEDPKRPQASEI